MKMEIFNFIASACSILSLFISIFIANKVIKITKNIKVDSSKNQKVIGFGNKTAGNDMK
jgi:uncharacterized membrane protein HdeD (DUF308 family)